MPIGPWNKCVAAVFFSLFTALGVLAQTPTAVSGQILDANGLPYSYARVSASLNGCAPSGCTILVNNIPVQVQGQQNSSADVNGNFAMNLFCNTAGGGCSAISPSGTSWTITINEIGTPPPIGTGPQTCSAQLTISGASQNISSSFSGCPALSNITILGGTFAVKPVPSNAIRYVTPQGNDANDGLSWGTSKLTIYGALISLPGSSASPPTAGNGIVYVTDGVSANPTAGAGIWLMGSTDANYANPPAGWLRAAAKSISIIGAGCQQVPANGAGLNTCLINGGSSVDRNHPVIWLDTGANLRFENLFTSGSVGRGALLGIGSDLTGNVGLVNSAFENVVFSIFNNPGVGPAVYVGSNVFNVYFNHISSQGNSAQSATITNTGLSRNSNVLTITTATNTLLSGQKCGIVAANDPSFNGSFAGGITVVNSTTVTVPQTGANATSGGGVLSCDEGMGMVIDGGANNGTGSGLIWITNSEFNAGGIRIWGGTSGIGGIYVQNFYTESSLSPDVWLGGYGGAPETKVTLINLQNADTPGGLPIGVCQNDLISPALDVVQAFGLSCANGSSLGGTYQAGALNPLSYNATGFFGGHIYGQTDVARHSPQAVRFPNLVPSSPSSWAPTAGMSITTGIADNEGGTNAAEFDWTSGGANFGFFGQPNITTAIGDVFICGVWARSLASFTPYIGAGYSGGNPFQCGLINNAYTFSYAQLWPPANSGDGEWEWFWYIFKISSQTGASNQLRFGFQVDSTHNAQLYNPIAVHIPAGTMSDGDIFNYAIGLRGYFNSCIPGQLCDISGPLVHSNAPNLTVSPEALGSAAGLSGTGACATITTQVGGSWAGSFKCTGTSGAATVTITPGNTAPNGFQCDSRDLTTAADDIKQSAFSSTTCTLSSTALATNDVITWKATAF